MRSKKPVKTPTILIWAAYLIVISLSIYFLIIAKPILSPLVFAGFIAALCVPLANFLERKLRFPKSLAATLCTIFALSFIGLLFFFIYKQTVNFAEDLTGLEDQIDDLIYNMNIWLYETTGNERFQLPPTAAAALSTMVETNRSYLVGLFPMLTNSLLSLTLFLVFTVLFLSYRDRLMIFIIDVLSGNHWVHRETLEEVRSVVRFYIIGIFTVSLILSIVNYIFLEFVFDVKHALFFAVFAGLLNIVPFVGPLAGMILPMFFVLATGGSFTLVGLIGLYFLVIQQIESYMITPNIVGSRVSINPMFTILGIFIGNMIWGVTGMIVFIPLIAMLKKIFDTNPKMRPYGYLLGDG
jgi:predicted PurR-regulated permease PerM